MSDQRTGMAGYEYQSQQQIQMIGTVFYNMLNMMGQKEQDTRLIDLSRQVKEMMTTQQLDNLAGPKVPRLQGGVMNLLKVIDLPVEDQIQLIKLGYGEVLKDPVAHMKTDSAV